MPLKPSSLDNSFGAESVEGQERRHRIRRVFEAVAPRYDLMNDLMSFGIHRWWKRRLRTHCLGLTGTVVDLAGGTGDVARLLQDPQRLVTVCDPSLAMMSAGKEQTSQSNLDLHWLAGEAEAIPFATDSVDLLTISFGLRNATSLSLALNEIYRVLKPGGHFVCLEFSRPQRWLAPFYDLYSWLVIPRLGAAVARQPIAYQYLVESIRRFPDQQAFASMIGDAGFTEVRWKNFSFGIASLHFGNKPLTSHSE